MTIVLPIGSIVAVTIVLPIGSIVAVTIVLPIGSIGSMRTIIINTVYSSNCFELVLLF